MAAEDGSGQAGPDGLGLHLPKTGTANVAASIEFEGSFKAMRPRRHRQILWSDLSTHAFKLVT
jgi:hypothetical protein